MTRPRYNETNPMVSVVLPIYNAEPYLREALDSLVNQTFRSIEIVCVNDGSKDNSLAIMQEYAAKDPRIVIDDGPNGGYGKAMNRGIDRAQGKYIGILEPDDVVELNMFETLVPVIENDGLDFVRADFFRFTTNEDDGNLKTRQDICKTRTELYGKVLNPQDDLSLYNVNMHNWTGLYRKSFLDKHSIRFHESPGARFQDNSFWFQTYCWATRIEYVHEPFYCHRDDNPNSSTNRTDLMFAMLDEWAWIRDYLRQYPDKENRLIGIFNYRKFHNCNFAFTKLADELQLPYLERYSQELNEALQNNEIDFSLFSRLEKNRFMSIAEDPEHYLEEYRGAKHDQEYDAAYRQGKRALFNYYVQTEGFLAAVGHIFHRMFCKVFRR